MSDGGIEHRAGGAARDAVLGWGVAPNNLWPRRQPNPINSAILAQYLTNKPTGVANKLITGYILRQGNTNLIQPQLTPQPPDICPRMRTSLLAPALLDDGQGELLPMRTESGSDMEMSSTDSDSVAGEGTNPGGNTDAAHQGHLNQPITGGKTAAKHMGHRLSDTTRAGNPFPLLAAPMTTGGTP